MATMANEYCICDKNGKKCGKYDRILPIYDKYGYMWQNIANVLQLLQKLA